MVSSKSDFDGMNARLQWNGGDPLCARRKDGLIHTVWVLDEKDRAIIAAGGVIHVSLMGYSQPPMRVTIEPSDTIPGSED